MEDVQAQELGATEKRELVVALEDGILIALKDDLLAEYLSEYACIAKPSPKTLARFREWVLADVHEFLKDNARSFGEPEG